MLIFRGYIIHDWSWPADHFQVHTPPQWNGNSMNITSSNWLIVKLITFTNHFDGCCCEISGITFRNLPYWAALSSLPWELFDALVWDNLWSCTVPSDEGGSLILKLMRYLCRTTSKNRGPKELPTCVQKGTVGIFPFLYSQDGTCSKPCNSCRKSSWNHLRIQSVTKGFGRSNCILRMVLELLILSVHIGP